MRLRILSAAFFLAFFVNCQQTTVETNSTPTETHEIRPIIGWGDSMMGGSGTKKNMMEYLEDELGRETRNFGVGGITSEAVAMLQGGNPFYLKPEGKSFPQKGALVLHNLGTDPYNKQTSSYRDGEIDGVHGNLFRKYVNEPPYKTIHYEFTPGKKNITQSLKDSVRFQFDDAVQNRLNPVIIWAGRNDSKKGEEIYKTRDYIQLVIDYLNPSDGEKKYLVLSVCNASSKHESKGSRHYNEILELNKLLKQSFGDHFVDVRSYLVNDAMKELSLEPTQEDLKEINADCIPTSLRSDDVHLNDNGNKAVAKYLAKIILERTL